MKNTFHPIIPSVVIILLMTISCRSTKQMSSTQQSTSTITTQSIDSLAKNILNTRKTTTTIIFLPMQTPGPMNPAASDVTPSPMPAPSGTPAAPAELLDLLIAQGGGTIIITQEEQLQNDTTTVTHKTDERTQQDESENHETQSGSNPPRASPIIDKIFYIFLLLAFIIILLQGRNR